MAHAREIGFGTVMHRGAAAAAALPEALVYAGLSLGALPAQMLAQTRPGARGALLLYSAIPPDELGGPWPKGVPLQIHIMEDDPLAAEDLEAARAIEAAELFVYPGRAHLFADREAPGYDEAAALLLKQRALAFLG